MPRHDPDYDEDDEDLPPAKSRNQNRQDGTKYGAGKESKEFEWQDQPAKPRKPSRQEYKEDDEEEFEESPRPKLKSKPVRNDDDEYSDEPRQPVKKTPRRSEDIAERDEKPQRSTKRSSRPDDDDDDDDDDYFEKPQAKKKSRAVEEDDDDDDDYFEKPKRPSKTVSRREEPKEKPKRSTKRNDDDDDEDDDDDDDSPRRSKKAPVKKAKVRHHSDDDDDDDDDDDEDDDDEYGFKQPQLLNCDSPMQFLGRFKTEAMAILFHPQKYFEKMHPTGIEDASIIMAVSAGVYAVLVALFNLNFWLLFSCFLGTLLNVLFASALVTFALKHMGGKGTFEGTYKVIALSKVTLLFGWISLGPIPVGGIAALAYGVYMNILGLEKLHELPRKLVTTLLSVIAVIGFVVHMRFGL